MQEISPRIFVGSLEDSLYIEDPENWSIISACKDPSHKEAVGYTKSLPTDHPNYLILETDNHLYLNLVDMSTEFLPRFTNPIIEAAFSFIDKHKGSRNILIHCNFGISRSPSLGLAYLAKTGEIDSISFEHAKKDFIKKYPNYSPGTGISLYLTNNWESVMNL